MRCPQLTTVLGAYQGSDSAMCEAVSLDLSPITEDFQKMYSDWQQHLGSLQVNTPPLAVCYVLPNCYWLSKGFLIHAVQFLSSVEEEITSFECLVS